MLDGHLSGNSVLQQGALQDKRPRHHHHHASHVHALHGCLQQTSPHVLHQVDRYLADIWSDPSLHRLLPPRSDRTFPRESPGPGHCYQAEENQRYFHISREVCLAGPHNGLLHTLLSIRGINLQQDYLKRRN